MHRPAAGITMTHKFSDASVSYNLHVFFFQAEDGIRDYKVTGVQTCALPISNFATRGPPWTSLRHLNPETGPRQKATNPTRASKSFSSVAAAVGPALWRRA